MTREIKFRAWDGKEMWRQLSLNSAYFSKATLRGIEVMQFTGLKDKNGKDIYEGDVIEYSPGANWTVKYDEKKAKWIVYDAMNLNNTATFSLYSMQNKPVIGNIYENSELLT